MIYSNANVTKIEFTSGEIEDDLIDFTYYEEEGYPTHCTGVARLGEKGKGYIEVIAEGDFFTGGDMEGVLRRIINPVIIDLSRRVGVRARWEHPEY